MARGTQTEESDIDIAVLVRSYTKEMHEQMTDLVVDLELEYNKVLSVLLIDHDNKFKGSGKTLMTIYKTMKRRGLYYGRQHKRFVKIPV